MCHKSNIFGVQQWDIWAYMNMLQNLKVVKNSGSGIFLELFPVFGFIIWSQFFSEVILSKIMFNHVVLTMSLLGKKVSKIAFYCNFLPCMRNTIGSD